MTLERVKGGFTNSLFVAIGNVGLALVALVFFLLPRFTNIGALVCLLILLVLCADIILVMHDLWRSGTRLRAGIAVVLWLPLFLLYSLMQVWEGPLYVSAQGHPPHFQIRGLAMFCSMAIYGPEQNNPESYGDDVGLVWSINHSAEHFPFEASFDYGKVPTGFEQQVPAGEFPAVDPNVSYKVEVGRCMGGPQYFWLHGTSLSEYEPPTGVCWGDLKVPERDRPAWVRVNCKTRQPLPMSARAKERLKAYRENKIPFF